MSVRLSRRARCAVLAALSGALLVPALPAAAAAPPSPWLQGAYNAAASNANPAEAALTPATLGRVTRVRSFPHAGRDCYSGPGSFSAPLLAQSNVYAFDGRSLVSSVAATGARNWATPIPFAQFESIDVPAVSHGLVFVGTDDCGTNDPIGTLDAYRSSDGSHAYSVAFPSQDGYGGATVSGKYLVLASNEGEAREYELSVYRVQDGALVWTKNTQDDGIGPATPVVVGRRVFAPDAARGQLTAYDLATGVAQWTSSVAVDRVERGDTDGAGATDLYVESAGGIVDLDPATGRARYTPAGADLTYAVDGARVYARCTDAQVCAYDRATGAALWRSDVPTGAAVDGVVVAGGVAYVAAFLPGGRRIGIELDAATGRSLGRLAGLPVAVGSGRIAALPTTGSLVLYGLPGA